MTKLRESLLIATACAVWFSILMPWGRFADPDAFYHAHLSSIVWTHGPVTTFPWLDMTVLGTAFADQHFLYHLPLAPIIGFVAWVAPGSFAELWATQFFAVALATGATLVVWRTLRRIDPQHAWMWTGLLLIISGFTVRMLLGKASPLAVAAFIGAIGSMVHWNNPARRIPLAAFFFGLLFALSHGGWIIALAAAGLMLLTDIILQRIGKNLPWKDAVAQTPWYPFLGLVTGVALGLLLHPNRNILFSFLWTQIITAGIAPPAHLVQGMEWQPAAVSSLIATLAPLLLAFLAGMLGLFATLTRSANDQPSRGLESHAPNLRRLILLLMPVALTLALTLKSRRFVEYLAPALVLCVAALWQMVDTRAFRNQLRAQMASWPRMLARAALPIAILFAIAIPTRSTWHAWTSLRRDGHAYSFDAYRSTFAAISRQAQPGDRVFHSSWDEFPLLFAADDRLRYISGLDPAFLHDANPALSEAVRNLTLGRATSTMWEVIVEQTGSRFVFTTPNRHPAFDAALTADPRFQEIARDKDTAAYKIILP